MEVSLCVGSFWPTPDSAAHLVTATDHRDLGNSGDLSNQHLWIVQNLMLVISAEPKLTKSKSHTAVTLIQLEIGNLL